MKHFYAHLIEFESVFIELDAIDLSEEQKNQLSKLIDHNLHATIMDAVFSELSEDDKKILLSHLNEGNHDKIWEHLNSRTENIEEKIKKVAKYLKEQLHKDIAEARRLKK